MRATPPFLIRAGEGETFMELDIIPHFEMENERIWATGA